MPPNILTIWDLIEQCPQLKGVAIDAISIGAPNFLAETIKTHQILTGVGRFLLILEDLQIDPDLGQATRIYAWPLFNMDPKLVAGQTRRTR